MQKPPAHTDRRRAVSFGRAGVEYDRHRPRYPRELVVDRVDHDGIQVLRRRSRDRYRVGPVDGDRRTSPSPSSGTRGWHAWAAGSPRPAPEPGTRVYELLTLRTAVRRVRLHGLRHTFATLQSVGGGAFQAVVKVVGAQQLCAHTKHLRGLHPRRRYGGAGVGSPGCRAGNQRGGPRAEKERHHAHAVAALGAGLVPRHANGRPPNQDGMYTAKSPPMGPDRQGGLAVET